MVCALDGAGENVSMAVGPQDTVLYPVGSRVLAAVLIAICVVIEVSLVATAHLEVALRATPPVLLVAVGTFVLFWAPRVELTPAELVIVNPLRTHRISWPAIRDIETRWSLSLDTVRGRITAWAAPSPGPLSQLSRLRRDAFRVSLAAKGELHGAELSRSLVLSQWEAYRQEGVLGAVEGRGVATHWNIPAAVAIVVLGAGTLAGALLP
jgi:hypothetical protein